MRSIGVLTVAKRQRVERTVNHGTWTEAELRGHVRQVLRKLTMTRWIPAREAMKLARRSCVGKGRQRYEYQCAECREWWPEKLARRDHIVPAGSFTSWDDLPDFCRRLFVEIDGWQCLCVKCHDKKTKEERAKR